MRFLEQARAKSSSLASRRPVRRRTYESTGHVEEDVERTLLVTIETASDIEYLYRHVPPAVDGRGHVRASVVPHLAPAAAAAWPTLDQSHRRLQPANAGLDSHSRTGSNF